MIIVEGHRKTNTMDIVYGEWLYLKRKRSGRSQGAIASVLGVTNQSVGNWENNRSLPNLNPLQMLEFCQLLGVELAEMAEQMKTSPLYVPVEVAA